MHIDHDHDYRTYTDHVIEGWTLCWCAAGGCLITAGKLILGIIGFPFYLLSKLEDWRINKNNDKFWEDWKNVV